MNPIRKLKIMPLVIACVLFALGVVVIFVSDVVGTNMPAILGTVVLGVGIVRIIYGFLTYKEELDARNNITLGVLDVIWGIVMLILVNNNSAFVILFGIWCLISAVLEIAEMTRNIVAKLPFLGLLVDGGINLCFGIVMLINPWNGSLMPAFVRFVGVYLLLNAFAVVLITLVTTKKLEELKKGVVTAVQTIVVEETPVSTVVEAQVIETTNVEPKKTIVEAAPKAVKTTTTKKTPIKKTTTTTKKTTTSKTAKTPAKTTAAKKPATKNTKPKA